MFWHGESSGNVTGGDAGGSSVGAGAVRPPRVRLQVDKHWR